MIFYFLSLFGNCKMAMSAIHCKWRRYVHQRNEKKNIERTVSSTGKCRLNIAGFFLKSFGFPWREMGLLSRR